MIISHLTNGATVPAPKAKVRDWSVAKETKKPNPDKKTKQEGRKARIGKSKKLSPLGKGIRTAYERAKKGNKAKDVLAYLNGLKPQPTLEELVFSVAGLDLPSALGSRIIAQFANPKPDAAKKETVTDPWDRAEQLLERIIGRKHLADLFNQAQIGNRYATALTALLKMDPLPTLEQVERFGRGLPETEGNLLAVYFTAALERPSFSRNVSEKTRKKLARIWISNAFPKDDYPRYNPLSWTSAVPVILKAYESAPAGKIPEMVARVLEALEPRPQYVKACNLLEVAGIPKAWHHEITSFIGKKEREEQWDKEAAERKADNAKRVERESKTRHGRLVAKLNHPDADPLEKQIQEDFRSAMENYFSTRYPSIKPESIPDILEIVINEAGLDNRHSSLNKVLSFPIIDAEGKALDSGLFGLGVLCADMMIEVRVREKFALEIHNSPASEEEKNERIGKIIFVGHECTPHQRKVKAAKWRAEKDIEEKMGEENPKLPSSKENQEKGETKTEAKIRAELSIVGDVAKEVSKPRNENSQMGGIGASHPLASANQAAPKSEVELTPFRGDPGEMGEYLKMVFDQGGANRWGVTASALRNTLKAWPNMRAYIVSLLEEEAGIRKEDVNQIRREFLEIEIKEGSPEEPEITPLNPAASQTKSEALASTKTPYEIAYQDYQEQTKDLSDEVKKEAEEKEELWDAIIKYPIINRISRAWKLADAKYHGLPDLEAEAIAKEILAIGWIKPGAFCLYTVPDYLKAAEIPEVLYLYIGAKLAQLGFEQGEDWHIKAMNQGHNLGHAGFKQEFAGCLLASFRPLPSEAQAKRIVNAAEIPPEEADGIVRSFRAIRLEFEVADSAIGS